MENDLTIVEEKLFAADDALVEGRIARESHQGMKHRHDRDDLRLREKLSEVWHTDNRLSERVTAAANLFELLPELWREAMRKGAAQAVSDLLSSIAPEKIVYDGTSVELHSDQPQRPFLNQNRTKLKTPGLF